MKYAVAKRICREAEQQKEQLVSLEAEEKSFAAEASATETLIAESQRVQLLVEKDVEDIAAYSKTLSRAQVVELSEFKQQLDEQLAQFKSAQEGTARSLETNLREQRAALQDAVGKRANLEAQRKAKAEKFATLPTRRKTLEKQIARTAEQLPAATALCEDIATREADRKRALAAVEEQRQAIKRLKEAANAPQPIAAGKSG